MDTATLRVLVEINGVRRATKELRDVDTAGTRAARSANDAAGGFDRADKSARKASKGFAGLVNSLGGGGNGVRNFARNLDRFGGSAGGATATIGGFRIALAALVPIFVGFGGAAIAAGASLGPLIGLAAAAGNAFAAAAQGVGVFKLAIMGIGGALKEQMTNQGKAGGAAASNAGAQRSAARAIQSAQDGVRDSVRALSDAQREQRKAVAALGPAYTEARRKLADLREEVADSKLALYSATLAAHDAKSALAALLAGPSPRDLADAHRSVSEALKGERDAAQDLAAAHRELQELLKPAAALDLADAQDAVADATRNETRARLALNAQIADTNAILANPGASSDQKAAARLALADAENAIGDATRDSARARERLTALEGGPSQDAVAEARRRVSQAEYAVVKAAIESAQAREDLSAVEAPASARDLAEARLSVAVAENELADAQRIRRRLVKDLTAAEVAGVNGSQEIIDAREDIADAERAVADASRDVARAQQAVADAQASANESMAGGAAGAAALNDKFNDLPPAAQAFVRVLQSMKPKLDELRATAASGFFPGATAGLKAAMGSFGSVNKVVGETATVLGEAARKSGELVGSPAFGRDIETIGSNNAKVIDTLGSALRHVVSALRHVMVAAGPLTQWLADMIDKWALNAAVAAKAGRENGKLAGFFEKTRAITERLVSILKHLGAGFLAIGKAGKGSGDSIWLSIDRAAKRFEDWAESVKGQKALRDFFKETKELAAALIPVLKGIVGGIGFVILKALPLTEILRALGPYMGYVTVAFIAFKSAVLATALASKVATAAAWLLSTALKSALIARILVPAFWALNAALAANPIGLVVVAIAALVAGLVLAYTQSETFRNIVQGAFRAAATAFGWLLNAAKDVFDWLTDHWPLVLVILTGPIGLAILAIKQFGPKMFEVARGLLDGFISGVKSVVGAVVDAGRWIAGRVIDGVRGHVSAIADVGGWVVDRVAGGIKAVAGFASDVGGWIKNRIVDGLKAYTEAVGDLGGWVIGRIVAGLKAVAGVGADVGEWIKDKIVGGIKAVSETFMNIGGDIIGGIAQGIRNTAGKVIDAIKEAVTDRLPKFVKKALGIKSPSRVFAELGKNISLGMAQGITSEAGKVERAMADISRVPNVARGTVGAMGYVQPSTTAQPAMATMGAPNTGVTIMGDLVVQDRADADTVAARLAWLMENG